MTTLYELGMRLRGEIRERPGDADHPAILWMLERAGIPNPHDELPWCAAFIKWAAWIVGIHDTAGANARSWLRAGSGIELEYARQANDIVVFRRGDNPQAGHVAIYAFLGPGDDMVTVVGGNQSNGISLQTFPRLDVLGVRRLI